MAGFFGLFDYTKEGKGVYPDEPPKGPIAGFFTILGRKFWKICTINLMYVIFSLPALLLAFLGAMYITQVLLPGLTLETLAKLFEESGYTLQEGITFEAFAASQMVIVYFVLGMMLTGLSLIIAGPVHAGVTYLLRNYSREEHAFVWMDFKEQARKNLKQSLISSLISFLVTAVFTVNFAFYSTTAVLGSDILRIFLQTLVVVLFFLWCVMQMYLYPMMVTFNLSLKQLYRNCLLFSIFRLPLNILILLLSLIILAVIPTVLFFMGYSITMLLGMLWYVFIAFGLNMLLTNFFAYRGLDKYMIQKIKAAEEMNEETEEAGDTREESETEPDAIPDEGSADDDEKSKGGLVESPSGVNR